MRVNRSPSGSFMDIVRLSSPARLQQAGDQPLGAELAQRNARQLVLAVIAAWTPGDFTTVANARGRRIARQLGELERRGKALLDRHGLVLRYRLEPRAPARILLRQPAAPVVLLDGTFLRHLVLLGVPHLRPDHFETHCRNGKLNAVSNARASSSLRAVV